MVNKGRKDFSVICHPFLMDTEGKQKGQGKGGTKVRISAANVDMYTNRTYSAQSYEEEIVQTTSKDIYFVPNRSSQLEKAVREEVSADAQETVYTNKSVGGEKGGAEKKISGSTDGESGNAEYAAGSENTSEAESSENTGFFLRAVRISTAQQKKDLQTVRQQCIQYILDMLFRNRESRMRGEKGNTISYQEWLAEKKEQSTQMSVFSNGNTSVIKKQTKTAVNLGTIYDGIKVGTHTKVQSEKTCYYSEKERTAYQTTGTVVTADGRNIEFNLHFAMSRSFEQYYNENYETSVVSFCDPLVINLDSTMPSVSDQKFLFDLDADGVMDTISMLSNKSGYLALDKNGDGEINDGSELFGTKSGDGFKDLAAYDEDGNGWIDEGDSVWEKLMIWCMDENGKTELYHVSEKGIGAICLKNVSSDFSLNSLKTNQTNAAVRSTGIFLYENGNVGTVQHMDLAI